MLTAVEKILFLLAVVAAFYFGGKGFYDVYRAIARGRPDPRSGDLSERILKAIWLVLTQQPVLKARPVVSLLHSLIFYGFVYYFLVNLVDVLEGFFALHARGGGWNTFNLLADLLTAAVLIGITGMVIRRRIVRPKDFSFPARVPVQPEVPAGISRDSAIVAAFIVFHVGCRLMFKATQLAVEGADPFQPVGSVVAGLYTGMSPAAILINERFELNKILPAFAAGEQSPRPLLDFALNEEAAWACTTCNACIEICPVGNEQMLHIIDVRRERVLAAAEFPNGLKNTFNHMERAGNPWGIGADERMAWAKGLSVPVPTLEQKPQPEVLFWVGCAVAFDPRAQKIARSMAELFNAAGVDWAVIGKQEKCTGDPARRAGNEYLFAQMAMENVAVLDEIKPKTIVTTCPHCFHTIANEYPQFGGSYVVKHHTVFIEELIRAGKIRLNPAGNGPVTYHDPCYLGRHNGIFDAPRGLIESSGAQVKEPSRTRKNGFCCGAGGGQFWKEEEKGNERVSTNRYRELKETGAQTVATGCPFCMRMMTEEAAKEEPETALTVLDVAEIVASRLAK
jgi:Fe-S oxidoreductase